MTLPLSRIANLECVQPPEREVKLLTVELPVFFSLSSAYVSNCVIKDGADA